MEKKGKIKRKKLQFFLFMRFYLGGRNVINKKGLFCAKYFEFEEFTIVPFFCSSIQPQHTVFKTHAKIDWFGSYHFEINNFGHASRPKPTELQPACSHTFENVTASKISGLLPS
jgi:hypothetical protein